MQKPAYSLLVLLSVIFLAYSCDESGESGDSGNLPVFTSVTNSTGLQPPGGLGQAAAWADFNVDGRQDLIFTYLDFSPPNVFVYANNGGSFTDITFQSGIMDDRIRSVAWADYDNDGLPDLVAGTINVGNPPILYRNVGFEMFEDVSVGAGITQGGGVIYHTVWVDYNQDGYVDLFQANDGFSFLYMNNGDGTFTEVSIESGLTQSHNSRSAVWFDYNNDGYPDLFLPNNGTNTLYENNGDGTFSNVTNSAGLGGNPGWSSVSACTGDYNRDGFIDLYVGNISTTRNALYRNNGNGTFTDVTASTGTEDVGDARTCGFVDFDADGHLDIFTTNHLNPNRLYRNLGNGSFVDVAPETNIDFPLDIFSAAWGDYNNDAVMDVFMIGHLGTGLFRNSGNENTNITIELVGNGITTNASAIGSRVYVGDSLGLQSREVSGGRGNAEQDMLPVHFGIGTDTLVDIMVEWTDGTICDFSDTEIEGNTRFVVIQEECELIVR